ncbi:MAG TPA: NAD-dependent epimerase/dehydratase family protein [Longimicrobiales bacterium]|nr:NAD-dependent epimerase/dehydratase family protein [Longimicrobiales bacterium]
MRSGRRDAVLITGVAGFIGSNLADRLVAEGYRVVGVDDLSQGVLEQVPSTVEFHRLDVRSAALYPLLETVDVVFHLAAKNCISDCQTDPVATASINVVGTANVLEAARRAGTRKVVYAESSALYEGSAVLPTPEHEAAPESFYAVSKQAARYFAEAYARHHGMNLTALRYFCVYGPRQDYRRTIPPVMSAFILHLLRGVRPTIYGTGEKRRDFVYVDDVNDFHVQCLRDARTDGRVFNLGSGESRSVREIFEAVRRLLGVDVEPAYAGDLPGEARETRADISAARALGWSPRVGLEDGLRRTIDHIRRHVLGAEATAWTSA